MDTHNIQPKEVVSASKRLGSKEAAALAKRAARVIVTKGRIVKEFRPGRKVSSELIAAMLGPTGNLRAPCIKVGDTLLVGFNDEVYRETFGG